MRALFTLTALVVAAALSACAYAPKPAVMSTLPVYPTRTPSQTMLNDLPAPEHPIAVAVYGFNDQTGQFKLTTTGQTLSRAISQGGGSILMHSLQEAGNRSWFTVVEREQLKDVLNERQLMPTSRWKLGGCHPGRCSRVSSPALESFSPTCLRHFLLGQNARGRRPFKR